MKTERGGFGGAEGAEKGEEMESSQSSMRHADVPASINALSERIIGLAMEVHSVLGPGLLEHVYEDALALELAWAGIKFDRQLVIPLWYKGENIRTMRLDLIVEKIVIVELKSVARLPDWKAPQLVSQLGAADVPLGLIINFHHIHLRDGLTRRINARSSVMRGLPPRPFASSDFSAFIPKASV